MATDNTISIKIDIDADTGTIKTLAAQLEQFVRTAQESATKAKTALESAFDNLRIRGISEIKTDIAALQNSFRTIAQSGQVSWDEMSRASQAYRTRLAELQRELTGVQAHTVSVGSSTVGMRDNMQSVVSTLNLWQRAWMAWIAVSGLSHQIQEITQLTDTYKGFEARLKIVHQDTSEYANAQTKLYDIAMRTRAPLEETYGLYIKLADSVKALGGNQQDALQLTENISKAIKISGVSAASASAALVQLSQAFSSGVLRGDEFNSVMEQAPRLAKALADGLGVPIGQLRTMAEQGKFTADVVAQALMKQRDVLNAEFQQLPVTVGDAITSIKNQWLTMVGEWDKGSHFSDKIVAGLQSISSHLPQLVSGLQEAAIAAGVLWAAFNVDTARVAITKLITDLSGLEMTMSKLQATAGLVAAAIAGWEIGQMLNQFEVVRQAGVALVAGIEKVAAAFVFLKDAASAAFTTDTVTAAYDRYKVKLQEIDAIGQQLWQDASNGAQKASTATEAVTASTLTAKNAFTGLADDTKKLHDWMEALGNKHPFDGSVAGAKELAAALAALNGRDFLAALSNISSSIEKLSAQDLAAFRHAVEMAMASGVEGAQRLGNVLELTTAAAMKRLGIDAHAAATGIRSSFADSLHLLDDLAQKSQLSTREIMEAFGQLRSSAKSIPEIATLAQEIRQLGKAGQLSMQEIDSAFRSLARGGLDAFYQQLKAVDNAADLSKLKTELKSMYDAGVIGAKQYKESLTDLDAKQKEVANTQGMTRKEVEAYNASVKALEDATNKAGGAIDRERQILSTANASVQRYGDMVESAKDSNKEFGAALQDGSRDIQAQRQEAESHAKTLEKQAAQLRKTAATEVERANAAKNSAKALNEQLIIERMKLSLMEVSGTASATEINQQRALVQSLSVAAKEAQTAAAAQSQVASAAMEAAGALTKEAAAADTLAQSLSQAASDGSSHYQFTVSSIDWAGRLQDALSNLSSKFAAMQQAASGSGSAIERLNNTSLTNFGSSVYGVDALVASINQATLITGAYRELLEKLEKVNWDNAEAVKRLREESEVLLKVEDIGLKRYADKTRQLIAYIDEKQNLLKIEQQLKVLDENANVTWAQTEKILGNLGSALRSQVNSWSGWIAAAQQAIDQTQYLDDADLDKLKAGIDDAKQKLQELAQQAMDARDALGDMAQSLTEELMRIRGDDAGLEDLRYQKQLQQIQELYAKAGELGQKEYQEALKLAEQLHQEKMKQISERKQKELQSAQTISSTQTASANQTAAYFAKAKEAVQTLHETTLKYIDMEGVRFGNLQKIVDTVKGSAASLNATVAAAAASAVSIPTLVKPFVNGSGGAEPKKVELKLHAPSSGLSPVQMSMSETDVDRLLGLLSSVGMRTA